MPPPGVEVIAQHRDPNRDDGLFWPLSEPTDSALAAQDFDAIICLAGVTPGPGADLSQNARLAEVVLEAAHQAGIPRVILASSSAVYGAGDGTPFAETDATAPVNAYGEAKIAMEAACTPWRTAGLEVCCLRIGNVAGADALLLNVARAQDGAPLAIDCFEDGRGPVRSYIGAGTLARVLADLATHPAPLPPILNVAEPGFVFMEDLARAADHPFAYRPAQKGAFQRITLECSRLEALHAFDPAPADAARMVEQWKETLPQ
ncbi:MAG: NAD(P)-dependent oxidoreductase [Gymnodinialimonas sp.]